jgi:hypothetical protein
MRTVLLIQTLSIMTIGSVIAFGLAARVGAGIFLILVAFIAEAVASKLPLREVAGTNVYPADAVFALLSLAYVIRLLRTRYWTILDALWIVFGICIAFAWARGVKTSGFNIATNSMRDFFYFWAGVAYIGSFEWKVAGFPFVYRNCATASLILLIVVLSRIFFPLYSIDVTLADELSKGIDHVFETDRDFTALRFLTASQAFLISQITLMCIVIGSRSRFVDLNCVFIPLWVVFLVTLQHRTVWVTFVLCLLLLLPRLPLRRTQLVTVLGGIAFAVFGTAVWTAISSRESMMLRSLTGAVNEVSNAGESTFAFRLQLWENYLRSFCAGNPLELAIGQPFGTVVYSWIPVGRNLVFTDIFPHNFYIYTVYFTGIVGLSAVLTLYLIITPWSWSLASARDDRITGRDWSVLLIGQLIYSITYGLEAEQCIITGVAMGLYASSHSRQSSCNTRAPAQGQRVPPRSSGEPVFFGSISPRSRQRSGVDSVRPFSASGNNCSWPKRRR